MKKLLKLTIALLAIFTIACAEKFDVEQIPTSVVPSLKEYYLTINNKEFNFPSIGGNLNATVNASGVWNFIGIPAWIGINPAQGSGGGNAAVTISATENSVSESREAIMELQSPKNEEGWYANHIITATQLAAEPYLQVSNIDGSSYRGAVNIDGRSNSFDFYVDSNCEFEISSDNPWLSCSVTSTISEKRKQISITSDENTTSSERAGNISLKYATREETIRIYQSPANITAHSNTLNYEYTGGTGIITFESEANWVAYTDASFIELVADNNTTFDVTKGSEIQGGAGNGTFAFNISKNSSSNGRIGKIYVKINNNDIIEIPIEQGNVTFSISEYYHHLDFSTTFAQSQDIVYTSNAGINISEDCEWITAIDKGNGMITISVAENPDTESRYAEIIIKSAETSQLSQAIQVTQKGKTFEMYDSHDSHMIINSAGTEKNISFHTDGKWTATSSDPSWISISNTSGTPSSLTTFTMNVKIAANMDSTPRNGSITIKLGNFSEILHISQDGASLSTATNHLLFTSIADTTTLTFNTYNAWRASTEADWIKITPTEGSPDENGYGKVDVIVSANKSTEERKDTIIISVSNHQIYDKISVTQEGYFAEVYTDSLSFGHGNETKRVDFNTNGSWSASADSKWITLSQTSGQPDQYNNASFSITVASNESDAPRDGTVTINVYDSKWIIKIHQEAPYLSVDTELIELTHSATSAVLNFRSNSEWTASVEPENSWLTIDRTSGTGNSSYSYMHDIHISATANDENKERQCSIIITAKNQVRTITVKQEQKYLEIETPALDFTASGGRCSISVIKRTDNYYAYSDADWVTVQTGYNYNNGCEEVSVEVNANDSRYSRSAVVTIENDYNKSYKLNLTQKGRSISVSESELSIFAKGGSTSTSAAVDGEFTVSTNAGSWLTVSHEAGTNKITVNAEENETGLERTDYVTVSLAGQPAGEEVYSQKFAVKQYPYTNKINLEGFDDADKGVSITTGNGFTIKITTYSADKDYNKQNGGIDSTVNGYGDDKGNNKNGNGNITINGYGDDKNWNN